MGLTLQRLLIFGTEERGIMLPPYGPRTPECDGGTSSFINIVSTRKIVNSQAVVRESSMQAWNVVRVGISNGWEKMSDA